MKDFGIFVTVLIALFANAVVAAEFPALQAIFRFFGGEYGTINKGKDISKMTLEELGISRGQCHYDFVSYVLYYDRIMCSPDDRFIKHLLPKRRSNIVRKPPIRVKCLQPDAWDNTTSYNNSLLIMSGVKEIVSLLKPIGNATKRHEPGSCVLVYFYTETSLGCAHVAPYANMLPLLFPTLPVAAIDAFKFPSFNTEFGIVGLPTLLLFHQGRPVVKFYSDVGTFAAFVMRHTGIKPVEPVPKQTEVKGPLPLQPIQRPDYVLFLAWSFIILCVSNYFAKSRLCKQIVEMIKRNWRESEAQLERN